MNCPYCQMPCSPEDQYCTYCGKKLPADAKCSEEAVPAEDTDQIIPDGDDESAASSSATKSEEEKTILLKGVQWDNKDLLKKPPIDPPSPEPYPEPDLPLQEPGPEPKKSPLWIWLVIGIAGAFFLVFSLLSGILLLRPSGEREKMFSAPEYQVSSTPTPASPATDVPTLTPAPPAADVPTPTPASQATDVPTPTPAPPAADVSTSTPAPPAAAPEEPGRGSSSGSVEERVERIKRDYNTIQENLESYDQIEQGEGLMYYMEGMELKKASSEPYFYIDADVSSFEDTDPSYYADFFYRDNMLFFVFVYKGDEAHRFYMDGLDCYRYIDDHGTVTDYEEGVNPEEISPVGAYCRMGYMEPHWAGLI